MTKLGLLATVIAAIAISAAPALADAVALNTDTRADEATEITWETSFVEDSLEGSFRRGDNTWENKVDMLVQWTVEFGKAQFFGVELRDCGPRRVICAITKTSTDDAAPITAPTNHGDSDVHSTGQPIGDPGVSGTVLVRVLFGDLKCGKSGIGRAKMHGKLFMRVDEDGDRDFSEGIVRGYGFNVKV